MQWSEHITKVMRVTAAASIVAGLSLAGPAGVASATTTTSVTADPSVVAEPGTTVNPFAGAVITGTGTMEGVTIRMATGFNPSIDQMGMAGSHPGITATYTPTTGLLRLRGTAPIADYQAALRDVTYSQSTTTEGTRTFIVVAGTAIYLPATGNLYEYVATGSSITWTDARAAALARTFGPFPGHLVTISSQVENDVALAELTGNTWIGASDEAVEGEWRWMDGPEAGQLFWQGLGSASGGTPVDGLYSNWQAGEPNNQGGEHYAHMFSGTGDWNDFPNSLNVTGYLTEYEVDDIGEVASLVRLLVGIDSDGDGVPDSVEIADGTDPHDPDDFLDSDGNGVPDFVEIADGTDPHDPDDFLDSDGDGLSDYDEIRRGTNPLSADTDGDGFSDGAEVAAGTDPLDPTSYPGSTDGSGTSDPDHPLDSDGDGVPDFVEIADGTDPHDPSSYLDSDGDGVPDFVEIADGTDPHDASSFLDTTGDGVSDYAAAYGAAGRPRHCTFGFSGAYTPSTATELTRLYLAYLRRLPEADGLAYWSAQVDAGLPLVDIGWLIATSPEFNHRHHGTSDSDFASLAYDTMLCRQADTEGASYWMSLLAAGSLTREQLMIELMTSAEYRDLTDTE